MAAINAAWSILRDPGAGRSGTGRHLPAHAARTHAASAADRPLTVREPHVDVGRVERQRGRLAARRRRPGRRGAAARQPARQRAHLRAPHRVVPGRDRACRSRLSPVARDPPRRRPLPGRDRGAARVDPPSSGGAGQPRASGAGSSASARAPAPIEAGEERRDPVEHVLAHRQQAVPEPGIRDEGPTTERRHGRLQQVDAGERVRGPRQEQRRHVDRGPVRGPRPGRSPGRPAGGAGRRGRRARRTRACGRPRPGRARRRRRATPPGRRTSARRPPRRPRRGPAPRTPRPRPRPCAWAARARAPRSRGRARPSTQGAIDAAVPDAPCPR